MGKFKGIVYLTEQQYAEMYNNKTIDEDTQYVTDQEPVYSTYEVDAIAKSLQDQITSSAGGEFTKVLVDGVYQPTFDADTKANASDIPTKTSDLTNDSGFLTSIPSEYVTETELNNAVSTKANLSDIKSINDKIPTTASSTNQLADKDFVNSSVSTATATFRGTVNSVAELPTTGADINDYAFINTTDSAGNTVYKRYKYDGTAWVFEYELNNSSFTASQWATINSGLTSDSIPDTSDFVQKSGDTMTGDLTLSRGSNSSIAIRDDRGTLLSTTSSTVEVGNTSESLKLYGSGTRLTYNALTNKIAYLYDITDVMNNYFGSTTPTRTALFTGNAGGGNITLSQSWHNFDMLEVCMTWDAGTNATMAYYPVWLLKDGITQQQNNGKEGVMICPGENYWSIKTSSTENVLYSSAENAIIRSIYGIKFE